MKFNELNKEDQQSIINDLVEDSGNQLFGLPFSGIRKILYEYETVGIRPQDRIKDIVAVDRLNIQLGEAQRALCDISDMVLPKPLKVSSFDATQYEWESVVKAVKELSEDARKYKDLCR